MACGRCGKEANELHAFRVRESAHSMGKRERLCDGCLTEARENRSERIRAASSRQWSEARTADGRFDPAKLTGCRVEHVAPPPEQIAQENARWDRIFQRFIDPDYYYRSSIPALGSSFSAFAEQMEALCR
jgi:hypothetical protein